MNERVEKSSMGNFLDAAFHALIDDACGCIAGVSLSVVAVIATVTSLSHPLPPTRALLSYVVGASYMGFAIGATMSHLLRVLPISLLPAGLAAGAATLTVGVTHRKVLLHFLRM